MRKQFSMLIAATLLVCFTACNNEAPSNNVDGEGTLSINFGFEKPAKAAVSTAVPTTDWSNIKSMQLVLVQEGRAKIVRPVVVPQGSAAFSPQLFDRIPAGPYDIYLIANNKEVGNKFGDQSASLATKGVIRAGTNFEEELFELAGSSAYLGTLPEDGKAYGEASELFIGSAQGTILADQSIDVNITIKRAVSVLRVRIDHTDEISEAKKVKFTDEGVDNTSIRLRRHANSLKLTAIDPFSKSQFGANRPIEAFVSTKAFKTAEPSDGYNQGGSMGIDPADFTLWNDYLILPGGSDATSTEKFNLLISGHAPVGYVGVNGVVAGTGENARVWWQADVDKAIGANGILSLNVEITNKGYVGPNPPIVDTYGKITIDATIANWDAVTNVTVPM